MRTQRYELVYNRRRDGATDQLRVDRVDELYFKRAMFIHGVATQDEKWSNENNPIRVRCILLLDALSLCTCVFDKRASILEYLVCLLLQFLDVILLLIEQLLTELIALS